MEISRFLEFYTRVRGMRFVRRSDYPGGRFTNAFVGYDEEEPRSAPSRASM